MLVTSSHALCVNKEQCHTDSHVPRDTYAIKTPDGKFELDLLSVRMGAERKHDGILTIFRVSGPALSDFEVIISLIT